MANDPYDPKIVPTVLAGLVGGILLVTTVLGVEAYFERTQKVETASKSVPGELQDLAELRRDQEANLGTYRTINSASGIVSIPIERAIDLVVAEYSAAPDSKDVE